MLNLPPQILMLVASVATGLGVGLLAAWAMVQASAAGRRRFGDISVLLQSSRSSPAERSGLLRAAMPLIRLLTPMFSTDRFADLRAYMNAPYTRAGRPGKLSDAEVVASAALIGLAMTVFFSLWCAVLFGGASVMLGLIGLPTGFLAMVASLKSKADMREKRILRAIPYVLDLLVLVLRSGTSLTIAMKQVVEDYADHPVGEEFGQVLAEMEMGSNRQDAFSGLLQRVQLEDIRQLVDNIVQAEELGWPLADTLKRLSDRLANERVLRAEETAGKASVMVMLPSTLILAAVVLILFGPIIVRALRGDYSL